MSRKNTAEENLNWVKAFLRDLEYDEALIAAFVEKGYKSPRRIAKLNRERLQRDFPEMTPADMDAIIDELKCLDLNQLKRTISVDVPTLPRPTETNASEPTAVPDKMIPDKNLVDALARASAYAKRENELETKAEAYDIFISYRRARVGDARSLKQALKQHFRVFLDIDREEGLGVGEFQSQLESILHRTPVVIVLLTTSPSGPDDTERGGIDRSELTSMQHIVQYAQRGWCDFCRYAVHAMLSLCRRFVHSILTNIHRARATRPDRIEMAVALKLGKIVVPCYPGSEGSRYVGTELGRLSALDDVRDMAKCNAYPIYDDMYDESVGKIISAIKRALHAKGISTVKQNTLDMVKTAKEAFARGLPATRCVQLGFTAVECKAAGYTANDIYPLCVTCDRFDEVEKAVVCRNQKDVEELKIERGYFFGTVCTSTTRLRAHSIRADNGSASDVMWRSQDKDGSHPFGLGPDRPLRYTYSASDISALNLNATKLKRRGYSAADCRAFGFDAVECLRAGYTPKELYPLCKLPSSMSDYPTGTMLICLNQKSGDDCAEPNVSNAVFVEGHFVSKLVRAVSSNAIHTVKAVSVIWTNSEMWRNQHVGGFPPFGFGPDRLLEFS